MINMVVLGMEWIIYIVPNYGIWKDMNFIVMDARCSENASIGMDIRGIDLDEEEYSDEETKLLMTKSLKERSLEKMNESARDTAETDMIRLKCEIMDRWRKCKHGGTKSNFDNFEFKIERQHFTEQNIEPIRRFEILVGNSFQRKDALYYLRVSCKDEECKNNSEKCHNIRIDKHGSNIQALLEAYYFYQNNDCKLERMYANYDPFGMFKKRQKERKKKKKKNETKTDETGLDDNSDFDMSDEGDWGELQTDGMTDFEDNDTDKRVYTCIYDVSVSFLFVFVLFHFVWLLTVLFLLCIVY